MPSPEPVRSTHFIRNIIQEDLQSGKHQEIVTRFPPEPNGYLHIGHAKSIFLNFGLVKEFPGHCFMRFDDTNPINEDEEYVQAILEDVLSIGVGRHDVRGQRLLQRVVVVVGHRAEIAVLERLDLFERAKFGHLFFEGFEVSHGCRSLLTALDR